MSIRFAIIMGGAAFMTCANATAEVAVGSISIAPPPPPMKRVEPPSINRVEPRGMAEVKFPEAGSSNQKKGHQRGLSREQIDRGCMIVGEYIECPGDGMRRYRHTLEIPQFGLTWQVYVPGTSYTSENRVDRTRTQHTSIGANLPDNSLKIEQNGTYLWKARGEIIRGRWIQRDDNHLVLQRGYEGADWAATTEKLGADEVGKLLLWHDNEWLAGRLRK